MNTWHLVALFIGYFLGKDHADLGSILLGILLGLVALKFLGWGFGLFVAATGTAGNFFQKPIVKKVTSNISYLISFILTHWMLIFISLILAMPIAFIADSIMSGVDTARTLIVSTVILFPIVEILYHIRFRKKKRQIFGFDV